MRHTNRPVMPVYLTKEEIETLREALDSHVYWQLSEESERRDGSSTSESEEIKACEKLAEHLAEALKAAEPKDPLTITNIEGRRFFVRVVRKGERYGLDDCLVHGEGDEYERKRGDDPLIEFYDLTYTDKFGERGQFVSRYYASTLAEHTLGHGLCLDGGVPEWSIDGKAFAPVVELARQLAVR